MMFNKVINSQEEIESAKLQASFYKRGLGLFHQGKYEAAFSEISKIFEIKNEHLDFYLAKIIMTVNDLLEREKVNGYPEKDKIRELTLLITDFLEEVYDESDNYVVSVKMNFYSLQKILQMLYIYLNGDGDLKNNYNASEKGIKYSYKLIESYKEAIVQGKVKKEIIIKEISMEYFKIAYLQDIIADFDGSNSNELAIESCLKALEVNPRNISAQNQLVDLYSKTEQYDELYAHFMQILTDPKTYGSDLFLSAYRITSRILFQKKGDNVTININQNWATVGGENIYREVYKRFKDLVAPLNEEINNLTKNFSYNVGPKNNKLVLLLIARASAYDEYQIYEKSIEDYLLAMIFVQNNEKRKYIKEKIFDLVKKSTGEELTETESNYNDILKELGFNYFMNNSKYDLMSAVFLGKSPLIYREDGVEEVVDKNEAKKTYNLINSLLQLDDDFEKDILSMIVGSRDGVLHTLKSMIKVFKNKKIRGNKYKYFKSIYVDIINRMVNKTLVYDRLNFLPEN